MTYCNPIRPTRSTAASRTTWMVGKLATATGISDRSVFLRSDFEHLMESWGRSKSGVPLGGSGKPCKDTGLWAGGLHGLKAHKLVVAMMTSVGQTWVNQVCNCPTVHDFPCSNMHSTVAVSQRWLDALHACLVRGAYRCVQTLFRLGNGNFFVARSAEFYFPLLLRLCTVPGSRGALPELGLMTEQVPERLVQIYAANSTSPIYICATSDLMSLLDCLPGARSAQ